MFVIVLSAFKVNNFGKSDYVLKWNSSNSIIFSYILRSKNINYNYILQKMYMKNKPLAYMYGYSKVLLKFMQVI